MKKCMRGCHVAVAVSGGVDSLCALLLLLKSGCKITALHARLHGEGAEQGDLERYLHGICQKLRIGLHIVDLGQIFETKIIRNFAADYASGLTPNPCVICNRDIKFGSLHEAAMALGADYLATGHYASLARNPYAPGWLIARGADGSKDQSYFLALLHAHVLEKIMFPLAHMRKPQCRQIVEEAGVAPFNTGESQDICFLADSGGDYREFLLSHWHKYKLCPGVSGPIFLREMPEADGQSFRERPVGAHAGLWQYTTGQRRGLGIAWREPLYVLAKDFERNAIIVASKEFLGMLQCRTSGFNAFVEPALWPDALFVKLRYRQPLAEANIKAVAGGLCIELAERQLPTAAGQVAAVYDGQGRLLAGGIIREFS